MTIKPALCLLLMAAAPLVTDAQDPQHPASGAGPSPIQLQVQALEQARSIAQASADQNKAAIEAIKNLAQASIDDSRETLKNTSALAQRAVDAATQSTADTKSVFAYGTSLVAFIVALVSGVAIFFGVKEYRGLKTELEVRFEAKLKELSDQFAKSSKEIHIWASKVSIAIPHYTARYNAFLDKRGALSKDELNDEAKWLRTRVQEIGDFAEELQDKRTVSWVQSQHALLHYFEGQYVEALGWQLKACSFVAPDVKFDRERNLACIAGRAFQTTRDRDALKVAIDALKSVETYVTRRDAKEMLADDSADLETVFDNDPDRLLALQRRAQ